MQEPDYYEVLGCTPQAATEQIQAEFRVRAQQCHPDRAVGCRAQWERTRAAWEVLGDPQLRAQYDRWRAACLPVPFAQWVAARSSATVHWMSNAQRTLPAPPPPPAAQPDDVYELFRAYRI